MQRCAIVIHSVNGNVYIIANHMKEVLVELGVDARLYRVADEDLHIWANKKRRSERLLRRYLFASDHTRLES